MNATERIELKNLDELAGGALAERFGYALRDVFANILDPNTDATKTRKIDVKVTFKPNAARERVEMLLEVKPTLAPPLGVATTALFGMQKDGTIVARELTAQLPGQLDLDGNENNPKVVNLTNINDRKRTEEAR